MGSDQTSFSNELLEPPPIPYRSTAASIQNSVSAYIASNAQRVDHLFQSLHDSSKSAIAKGLALHQRLPNHSLAPLLLNTMGDLEFHLNDIRVHSLSDVNDNRFRVVTVW